MIRTLRWFGLVAVCSGLVACSDGEASTPTTTVPFDSVAPAQNGRPSDGVLTIGVLVPTSVLSENQRNEFIAVVDSAARVINANGGYGGQPVRLLWADETTSLEYTQTIVAELVTRGNVDVLIGPSSSALAGSLALDVIDQGVGVCSPAATSALLSELPDQGMMIRTTPNDAAIARAMIDLTADTGFGAAALVYPDDPYGRAFAELLHQFLDERGLNRTTPGSPEQNYDYPFLIDANGNVSNAEELTGLASRVVLIVGNEDTAKRVLPLLKEKRIIVPDSLVGVDLTTIRTGDDSEFASSGNIFQGVTQDLTSGSTELVTSLRALDPQLGIEVTGDVPLLAATVDCLNILVLTAIEADNDDARTFMSLAFEATNTGTRCRTFVDCAGVLQSRLGIDYDGSSGELSLDSNGDATAGALVAYTFGPDGRAVLTNRLRVTTPS